MKKKIKVGIIGGTGYTAGELLRILNLHPNIQEINIISNSCPGKKVSTIHDDLIDMPNIFINKLTGTEDMIFLCLGHGIAPSYLSKNLIDSSTKIIDLSNDFRLESNQFFLDKKFIYGLPELNLEIIKNNNQIANPGCFATAIQLALLPLAKEKLLKDDIHISAITGSTGAGKNIENSVHFSWRNNNISTYKEFNHQHLSEIQDTLNKFNIKNKIRFIPYRGNFTRGIFASIYTKFDFNLELAYKIFEKYYKYKPFVRVLKNSIHLKQVIGTNFCFLHLKKHSDQILISVIIDNLIKGASGQAVQNMNIMFNWKETLGLNFKSLYF